MRILKFVCCGLAAALVMTGGPAGAQVYSWKDPASGQSRFSNIAPPWYSHGEVVSGPRVIATVGEKVIDDTALPYERRLLISGKSKDTIDKLLAQKQREPAPAQQPNQAAARQPANGMATRGASGSNRGS